MKETRLIKVQDRVIRLTDIRKLANVLWDEWSNATKKSETNRLVKIEFSVRCDDSSLFTSENISIFDDDSIVNLKRVVSIEMAYWNYQNEERIKVNLAHDDSFYGNTIEVTGNDSKWVNGTIRAFEDIVSSFTPQNTFVKQYKSLIHSILAFGMGLVYVWFISFITPSKPSEPEPEWLLQFPLLAYVIKYVFAYIVGYLPSMILTDKLKSLWYQVEFQIGPEHKLIEKKRRLQIANVFVLGVLPIFLSLIYDVGKALFK